jgi:hypothetical protein
MAVYAIITAFTISRIIKMVNRDDPSVYQVDRGLDLVGGHDEEYDFEKNHFRYGIGAYIYEYNNWSAKYHKKSVDLNELFKIYVYQNTLTKDSIGGSFIN